MRYLPIYIHVLDSRFGKLQSRQSHANCTPLHSMHKQPSTEISFVVFSLWFLTTNRTSCVLFRVHTYSLTHGRTTRARAFHIKKNYLIFLICFQGFSSHLLHFLRSYHEPNVWVWFWFARHTRYTNEATNSGHAHDYSPSMMYATQFCFFFFSPKHTQFNNFLSNRPNLASLRFCFWFSEREKNALRKNGNRIEIEIKEKNFATALT